MFGHIIHASLRGKVMTTDEAAQFINHGDALGISDSISAGYPKAPPTTLANRGKELHAKGEEFAVDIYTGAFTTPDCSGVVAEADIIHYHMPYQEDPALRKSINSGKIEYQDIHLSHSTLYIEQGFLPIDTVIVEVIRITEDGHLISSSSVNNNVEWIDDADRVIIEVNSQQSEELEDMYDIYRTQYLPNHTPVLINVPDDHVGTPYIDINLDKVVVVVETNAPDCNSPFKPLDEASKATAGHFLDFFEGEVRADRLAYDQHIMQSGVGNVPNAMMTGLLDSKLENIKAHTEVIQDGMVDLIDIGEMTVALTASFSLSPEAAGHMNNEVIRYCENIILRPQQISSRPKVARRVGLIATNDMIEADIYGNANSTHINGSRIMNDIGGSGDFTRNAFVSSFISLSLVKDGATSIIVPFVSYTDHTEHDTMVIVTECGFVDLYGPASRDRVVKMISAARPEYQPLLEEYYERTLKTVPGMSTPHDPRIVFDFRVNMTEEGSMKG